MSNKQQSFVDRALTNPVNAALIDRLARIGLNDCYLTAGCLFQAIWNRSSGRDPAWGVKDYDVFYFDDCDVSWEAEDRVIRTVAAETRDLAVRVEVRNQARVHLWYEKRFGFPYPQLLSAREGIDRFLIAGTCLGIDVATGRLYAPNDVDDAENGILRLNQRNPQPDLFRSKANRYQARWPWLTVLSPDTHGEHVCGVLT